MGDRAKAEGMEVGSNWEEGRLPYGFETGWPGSHEERLLSCVLWGGEAHALLLWESVSALGLWGCVTFGMLGPGRGGKQTPLALSVISQCRYGSLRRPSRLCLTVKRSD